MVEKDVNHELGNCFVGYRLIAVAAAFIGRRIAQTPRLARHLAGDWQHISAQFAENSQHGAGSGIGVDQSKRKTGSNPGRLRTGTA